ncbi:MAG: hypothetical protein ACRYFU_17075, partial [Janthinobacterium lividum]
LRWRDRRDQLPDVLLPCCLSRKDVHGRSSRRIHKGRFLPYGKILVGGASAAPNGNYPLLNAPASYPVVAIGGGLEIRCPRHLTVRAIDYEQQEWLEYHPNGLTPTVVSFGAAYRFQ